MSDSNGMATNDELHNLHGILARAHAKRIADGTATAADLKEAREFLKDNKIQQLAVPGTPMADLAASLPFAGTPDYAQ